MNFKVISSVFYVLGAAYITAGAMLEMADKKAKRDAEEAKWKEADDAKSG